MRLYLIRHGRQSDTRCNVDVGLSAEGRAQAELVGKRLIGLPVARIVSSDMIRARETAEIINTSLGLRHEVVPALRELDFGEMEGLTDAEIEERFTDFKHEQAQMQRDLHYPGGENIAELLARALPALSRIVTDSSSGPGPASTPGSVVIVTHGVVIRSLVGHALRMSPARWRLVAPGLENGAITELRWQPDTQDYALERLNDYAHLEHQEELLRAAWGVAEN